MLNPRALKLFHLTVEKGSLTGAAETANLSPPAASRLISLLEEDLKFQLFSRHSRNLTLTDEGRRFWRDTQAVLSSYEGINQIARTIRESPDTSLRVLSTAPIATSWISPALSLLKDSYPNLKCAVEIVGRTEWLSNVGNQTHDVAVGSLPITNESLNLRTTFLSKIQICAVLHKDHPLSTLSELRPVDIADQEIIALYPGQLGRARIDEFFQSEGFELQAAFETSSSLVSLSLCEQNLGITLVPSIYLGNFDFPNLVTRPIVPQRWLSFAAVTSRREGLSEIQSEFINFMKKISENSA